MIRLVSTRIFGGETLRESWLINPAHVAAIRFVGSGATVHLACPLRELTVTDPESVQRLAALESPARRSVPDDDIDLSESF